MQSLPPPLTRAGLPAEDASHAASLQMRVWEFNMDIFLVEDSASIRRLLARRLDAMPGTRIVGEAVAAPQAVAMIDWLQPQTVLLDMSLTTGTGLDVLRALRAKGFAGRVLVLTHQVLDAYRQACLDAGADGFYDKASGLDTLFDDLDVLLDRERQAGTAERPSDLLRDGLTGLYGQVALLERLDQVLRMIQQDEHSVAVYVMVLRGLETLRAVHGDAVVEELQRELARRLSDCTAATDLLARHADEQFALVLTRVAEPADATLFARELRLRLAEPFQIQGRVLSLQCDLGMALFPRDAVTARGLLTLAEAQAYGASVPGRASTVVH